MPASERGRHGAGEEHDGHRRVRLAPHGIDDGRGERRRIALQKVQNAGHQKTMKRDARAARAAIPSASIGVTGCAVRIPACIGGDRGRLDVEGDAELPQRRADLGDVVAVDELVGVLVEEVRARAGEHDADLVLSRHHPEGDAHRLVGAVGGAGVFRDEDEHRLSRHGIRAL